MRQPLRGHVGDEARHAVVDAPPGEDDFRVVPEHLRFMSQVIGVDADAMPADKARLEGHEVPLGRRRAQYFRCIDAHAVKDDGELVHQRDVEVALRVLDHFGRFRYTDARSAVHAGQRHTLV